MEPTEIFNEDLLRYVEAHTATESPLLQKINRETHMQVLKPQMLSGHLQGRVLSMLSHMISPQRIVEVGTYTGYSALCLAEGLQEGGQLITIDKNEELYERVKGYFAESDYAENIEFKVGDAQKIIPDLPEPIDLAFIDADKQNYPTYYEQLLPKMRKGAYLIIDNVLWYGKVIPEGRKKLDPTTQVLMDFNDAVHEDDRVENVLFPVRDGLMILRKK